MASSDTLKEYLKQEVQKAIGFTVDSAQFDKTMGAFAIAIDKYLKTDIKVDIDIEAKGSVDISRAVDGGGTPTPGFVPQTTFDVDTKTTTKGNLV